MVPGYRLSVRQATNKRPAVKHHSHGGQRPCTAHRDVAFDGVVTTNRFSPGARSTRIVAMAAVLERSGR